MADDDVVGDHGSVFYDSNGRSLAIDSVKSVVASLLSCIGRDPVSFDISLTLSTLMHWKEH